MAEPSIDPRTLDQETGITDDRCAGRCHDLLDWFIWETRGLLSTQEAHEVLDMLLNRLASDQSVVSGDA